MLTGMLPKSQISGPSLVSPVNAVWVVPSTVV
jgi:hypothetical protein